jgi:hypothetical protein
MLVAFNFLAKLKVSSGEFMVFLTLAHLM